MRFTVVIPNFNSGKSLERAIRSVLAQNAGSTQIILADGGSTDESAEIIQRYSSYFDPLLPGPDDGQVDGLNRAFAHATGDIFCWLCADDELLPGAFRAVEKLFAQNPEVEVVAGACRHHYADRTERTVVPPSDPWAHINVKNVFNQPSVFWRSSLHRRLGQLDGSYRLAFDWDWWCRMKEAGARVVVTRRALSQYYFSNANKTSLGGRLHVDEGFRIIRRYGPGRGRIAFLYRSIYKNFDLKGCLDRPPACSFARRLIYRALCLGVHITLGRSALIPYNWHFASRQERGLEWWHS